MGAQMRRGMLKSNDYFEIAVDLGVLAAQMCDIYNWLCELEPEQIEGVRKLKEAVDSLIYETEGVRVDVMNKCEACDE